MPGESGVNVCRVELNAGDLKFYRNGDLRIEDEDVFIGDLSERFRASSGLCIRF